MVIDCSTCAVRGPACGECVVSVLLGAPPDGVVLDPAEQGAFEALAAAGLVPPLRLVSPSRPRRGPDPGRSVAAAG